MARTRARIPRWSIGLVLLAASGLTTWAHRLVYQSAIHGPAQVAELAFALSTMVLACMGMLMLIGGKWCEPEKMARRIPRPPSLRDACDTRRGVAAMQASRALATAMRALCDGRESVSKPNIAVRRSGSSVIARRSKGSRLDVVRNRPGT
jgi:hypothetical protein